MGMAPRGQNRELAHMASTETKIVDPESPNVTDLPVPPLRDLDLSEANVHLATLNPIETIEWAKERFGDGLVMSTSFGIQSAAMLHLATTVVPDIPVIWIDTGYLPPETYRFAEDLIEKLSLNIQVYQSPMSPARMETLHGKLWEEGTVDALNLYDRIRKVEPMQRALQELGATAWIAGLRADQTEFRATLDPLVIQDGRGKIHPILNWSSRDIHYYMQANGLSYHPLWDEGYVTVGDWHSSRPLTAEDSGDRDTRFGGLKEECGVHLPESEEEAASLESSQL